MAKRRDAISRRTTRENRQNTRENGGKPIQSPMKVRRDLEKEYGRDTASGLRMQGRRGVRARARLARIQARKANGTYRQPTGGKDTNS